MIYNERKNGNINTILRVYHEHKNQINVEKKLTKNSLRQSEVTFKGGLTEDVHRWFRLTPSFAPNLVRNMLNEMGATPTKVVLDPFTGKGTTIIECKRRGFESVGVEVNPLLHWISKTSVNWDLDEAKLNQLKNELIEKHTRLCNSYKNKNLNDTINQLCIDIPKIHRVDKWWNNDILKDLLIIKKTISDLECEDTYKDVFNLALNSILVNVANVSLGRLQLHFIDRKNEKIDVNHLFYEQLTFLFTDLNKVKHNSNIKSTVYLGDSTRIHNILKNKMIDFVVTSPPYPNRYSYVWNTRPNLYFFDFFQTPKEASTLDKATIGGTWGTATSVLSKGIINPHDSNVEKCVAPICEDIRKHDNLMANYVMNYFNQLYVHLISQTKVLNMGAGCAYVVGNSRIKGIEVETDILLAKLFESLNYEILKIDRVRKRHSGIKLHEAIVYARNMNT